MQRVESPQERGRSVLEGPPDSAAGFPPPLTRPTGSERALPVGSFSLLGSCFRNRPRISLDLARDAAFSPFWKTESDRVRRLVLVIG